MKFSNQGEEMLMLEEGFVDKPTPCLAGCLTIGYGHKIKPGEKFGTITKGTGLLILAEDVKPLENILNNYIPVKLTQSQFDALIIFMFNIGDSGFLNSSVYKNVKAGNFEDATTPWAKWINISKYVIDPETGEKKKVLIPVEALKKRRKREIELFKRR